MTRLSHMHLHSRFTPFENTTEINLPNAPLASVPVHDRKEFGTSELPSLSSGERSVKMHTSEEFLKEHKGMPPRKYLDTGEGDMSVIRKKRRHIADAMARAKDHITQFGLNELHKKHERRGIFEDLHRCIYNDDPSKTWPPGLWEDSLKIIEGQFGSAVMLIFAFCRWVFLLDLFLSCLWIGAIIVPFCIHPPSTFRWSQFKQMFKADGLDRTWIFYGGYLYNDNEQRGWYKATYMFPATLIITFLSSMVALLSKIAKRITGSGDMSVVYTNIMYPFSTLVFASWDFRITSLEASTKLRRGIRMQLRELLADSTQKEESLSSLRSRMKYYKDQYMHNHAFYLC